MENGGANPSDLIEGINRKNLKDFHIHSPLSILNLQNSLFVFR